ncbi:MAG TPA: DegT/DnrJ/EryC1/StrS family aminotransferase [Gemmatimonadaceae bacterium]|jgi:dTDP-4-amino-4,6-dideoxygalactose transaminase
MATAISSAKTREIPFFNYRGAFVSIERELMATIRDVVGRGAFIMQRDLSEFEAAIASYLGVKHAFGVGNATDGLIIAFRAAGLRPGDEVIFPSHTMVASPSAVHFAGGVPVPVDIGPDHLIDPKRVEAALTPKTRFIMPVQLNGRTCDMDAIERIARAHDLRIVEDAAQALGSRFRDRYAGSFGAAASFSFYPAKVLGCLGDGGMVVTNDDSVADRIHQLRDHGRDRQGDVASWGMNSRLDNLQAAILHLQFRVYGSIIEHRRTLANAYQATLVDVPELQLPPAPDADPRHFDVYQNYELEADRRDELKSYLKDRGIGTLIQWGGKAVHQFERLGFKASLPVTERFFTRCLMLPMNTMVSVDDAEYIAGVIRAFYSR